MEDMFVFRGHVNIYQNKDGSMCHCVSNDHEEIKESYIDHHSCKSNHVTDQEQKKKNNPVQRFSLQNNKTGLKKIGTGQYSPNIIFTYKCHPPVIFSCKDQTRLLPTELL